MKLEELIKKLELTEVAGCEECFALAEELQKKHGSAILTDVNPAYLGKYADEVIAAGKSLAKDPDNSLYAYFLAELMIRDCAAIKRVGAPRASQRSVEYDSLPLFSMLWCVPAMLAEHRRRGIPEWVSESTVGMIENQIGDFVSLMGHTGISRYTAWMTSFIACRIIRVGRFNLEVKTFGDKYKLLRRGSRLVALADGHTYHRSGRVLGSAGCEDAVGAFTPTFTETDEYFEGAVCDGVRCGGVERFYKADGWELYLSGGEPLVSVHIPSGGPLSPDVVSNDLRIGGDIIRAAFGDFKAYYCSSWLLDSEIASITGRESNITRFGDRFFRYPIKSSGDAVYSYVWHLPPTTPVSELPDAGSFANALRAHIAGGGYIYGAAGVFTEIV